MTSSYNKIIEPFFLNSTTAFPRKPSVGGDGDSIVTVNEDEIRGGGNKDDFPPEPPRWNRRGTDRGVMAEDGLVLCTESLGFESCGDDWRADEGNDDLHHCDGRRNAAETQRQMRTGRRMEKKKKQEFPPPLKRCFLFQAVRKDGRLKIRQTEIQRPEILRAIRQNGRLILHFATENYNLMSESQRDIIGEEHEYQEQLDVDHLQDVEDDDDDDDCKWNQEAKKQEKELQGGECQEDGDGDGDDGVDWRINRCHELVMNGKHDHHRQYHHNGMHLWSQLCVTIR